MTNKLDQLKSLLQSYGSVAVAFSGGVDSTFLLKVARDVLGDNVMAITARSETCINTEYDEARAITDAMGVRHEVIVTNELDFPNFRENPPDRCYFCKKELFTALIDLATQNHMAVVIDGTNADDTADYRPGRKALAELGVKSPLREAGFTKPEIRKLSEEFGLPTASKPSMACLASRFPYGIEITPEKLKMVADAEAHLRTLGLVQLRVRHHNDIARIEVLPEHIARLAKGDMRRSIVDTFRKIGYQYVTLDLQGYRTGSLNEVLDL